MSGKIKAVVLAAGKGTRLQQEGITLPKVMRRAAGRPLLDYVLQALSFLPREDILLVVVYHKEDVLAAYPDYSAAEQAEQLGTGHAVQCALAGLKGFDGSVLVCCGDMPLMRRETYESLVHTHQEEGNWCTLLSGHSEEPLPYGRIVRDGAGDFARIVEDRDCTPEQKKINELNVGIYVFDSKKLFACLKELKNSNAQGEYYLTDVPAIMMSKGYQIGTYTTRDDTEILGVNTPEDLALCEAFLKNR